MTDETSDSEKSSDDHAAKSESRETSAGVASLPAPVRVRLEELTKSLKAALGDVLVGVLVHGSVVRGEYRPGDTTSPAEELFSLALTPKPMETQSKQDQIQITYISECPISKVCLKGRRRLDV